MVISMDQELKDRFSKISRIDPDDPTTWENKIFLTFDIDWAHDVVIAECIELVEEAGVPATWFVTHETPMLSRLRENPLFEIGIHPNFNFLFDLSARAGRNAGSVIDGILSIAPEATSVRSHHMTQSSGLLALFKERGITHDCNHFIPANADIQLKPWYLWNNIVRVPYQWEDDVAYLYSGKLAFPSMRELLSRESMLVFDFHPIHVYLNTEGAQRYEATRNLHYEPAALSAHRYTGYGSRSALCELLGMKHD